jgi:hypothetical protein
LVFVIQYCNEKFTFCKEAKKLNLHSTYIQIHSIHVEINCDRGYMKWRFLRSWTKLSCREPVHKMKEYFCVTSLNFEVVAGKYIVMLVNKLFASVCHYRLLLHEAFSSLYQYLPCVLWRVLIRALFLCLSSTRTTIYVSLCFFKGHSFCSYKSFDFLTWRHLSSRVSLTHMDDL